MIEFDLTEQIIGAAIEVHKHWGPGLYTDGPMSLSLLRLPLQTVRANLRLAIPAVNLRDRRSAHWQSLICADLPSVPQCLRGESSYGWEILKRSLGAKCRRH